MVAAPLVAVAVSGGVDSLSLLHATLHAMEPLGGQVIALHVHHNLQLAADDWLTQLQGFCDALAQAGRPLRLLVRRLDGSPGRGDSVEAWARRERYRALSDMARESGCDLVLLAHHRRDQAETVLLQALRGGGTAGLAAMPRQAVRDGLTWARPWLEHAREHIEAYAKLHGLAAVTDPSNADPRFARSRLRNRVWPVLKAEFPQVEAALVSSAHRLAVEREALQELALQDLSQVTQVDGSLSIAAWLGLSTARRDLALRSWLLQRQGRGATDALVARLMSELAASEEPARWAAPVGELRRYRGRLSWCPTGAADDSRGTSPMVDIELHGAGRYPVEGWGTLEVSPSSGPGDGVPLSLIARLQFRPRGGGEQFQRGRHEPPRSLKKQYQDAGVPAWDREGPIVFAGRQIVFVPGLGLDARAVSVEGEPRMHLRWFPAKGDL